jgi:broad specificity phosphatase PhoE
MTEEGIHQAEETGRHLLEHMELPDVIYVSPYLRTRQTLEGLIRGCPELGKVKVVVEERIREQEHGLSTVYNDWRIYLAFNPAQALLRKRGGDYEYRFLNGENKADVRDRVRTFLTTLIRENAGMKVLIVSHHLTLLAFRANLERWDREEFMRVDREESPINCGLTVYRGDSESGQDGRLIMESYNKKLY